MFVCCCVLLQLVTKRFFFIHIPQGCSQNIGAIITDIISMVWCKRDVSPLLTHWTYVSLVLTHRYVFAIPNSSLTLKCHKVLICTLMEYENMIISPSHYHGWWYLGNALHHIDGLVQERHNSSLLPMELKRLSCTKPSTWHTKEMYSWSNINS